MSSSDPVLVSALLSQVEKMLSDARVCFTKKRASSGLAASATEHHIVQYLKEAYSGLKGLDELLARTEQYSKQLRK